LQDNGQGVETKEVNSLNTHVDHAEVLKNSGSVLATLRTTGGSSNVQGKDASQLIVDTEDGTMSLQVALNLGYVSKDINGVYSDVKKSDASSGLEVSPAGSGGNDDDSGDGDVNQAGHLDAYDESRLNDIREEVGDSVVQSIVSQIASNLTLSEDGLAEIEQFKDAAGLTDAQADRVADVLTDVLPSFQQQATDFLTSQHGLQGDDYESFIKWVYGSPDARPLLMESIQGHYANGDMSGYTKLLDLFRTNGKYWKPNK